MRGPDEIFERPSTRPDSSCGYEKTRFSRLPGRAETLGSEGRGPRFGQYFVSKSGALFSGDGAHRVRQRGLRSVIHLAGLLVPR
jgi:hypothetical protein